MARQNPFRTARAPVEGDIVRPVVAWRLPLGGQVGPDQIIPYDVDLNGDLDLLAVVGGRLQATTPNGELLWKTDPIGLTSLMGVFDLGSDGLYEIVARTRDQVLVFSAGDGRRLWVQPAGELGEIGAVRIADLNHDGKLDLLVQECGCCRPSNGVTGMVYSFAAGAASPSLLYPLPSIYSCHASSTTIFDPAGNGHLAIAIADAEKVIVIDGESGQVLGDTGKLGTFYNYSRCQPVNLDASPGDELLCALNVNGGPGNGGRIVYAVRFSAGAELMWSRTLGDFEEGDLSLEPEFAVDLDGDGTLEIAAAGQSNAKVWTTTILDGTTGASLATVPGQRAAGMLPAGVGGKNGLFITTQQNVVSAWRFTRSASPRTEFQFALDQVAPLSVLDWRRAAVGSLNRRLLVSRPKDASSPRLFVRTTTHPVEVRAVGLELSAAPTLASSALTDDTDLLGVWASSEPGVVALLQDDGRMRVLTEDLADRGASIQIGGYYNSGFLIGGAPVAARLQNGEMAESVLATDSRGRLCRIDAKDASLLTSPKVAWVRDHATAPTVVPSFYGQEPGIVCARTPNPNKGVTTMSLGALRANGTELWTRLLGATYPFDVLPARITGDPVSDLLIQTQTGPTASVQAFSGRTGVPLWAPNSADVEWGLAPGTGIDWNADGITDFVTVRNQLQVISGANGQVIAKNSVFRGYAIPTAVHLGDGSPAEFVLHGGYFPITIVGNDLSSAIWTSSDDDRPYPWTATASCSGTLLLAGSSARHPSRLKLTKLSGPARGSEEVLVLAGGRKFGNEAEVDSGGVQLGQLGNASVADNLSGRGHPTVLIGSTDGWLYAVNPCDASLEFAHNFGMPVGEPILGDTDGDGLSEIVVGVADGYLYALRNATVDAPGSVIETDPAAGITDRDVAEVVSVDRLSATWSAVSGAEDYEIAVASEDGSESTLPWRRVGLVTQATATGLSFTDGKKYLWAVRAVRGAGRSAETLSDGVVVHVPLAIADAGSADVLEAGSVQPEAGRDAEDVIPDGSFEDAPADSDAIAEKSPEADPSDSVEDAGDLPRDAADEFLADTAATVAFGRAASVPGPDAVAGGGCSCKAAGGSRAGAGKILVALAALWLAFTRRSTRARGSAPDPRCEPSPTDPLAQKLPAWERWKGDVAAGA